MSQSKQSQGHTPGPWRADLATEHVLAANGHIVVYELGSHEPDANLIAAAPELLEALKQLFEHCAMVHSQWGDNSNQREADAAMAMGRAAIIKAEWGHNE